MVTLLGVYLPFILSGTLIAEEVFNYPGVGLLFFNAATSQDYPDAARRDPSGGGSQRGRLAAGRYRLRHARPSCALPRRTGCDMMTQRMRP